MSQARGEFIAKCRRCRASALFRGFRKSPDCQETYVEERGTIFVVRGTSVCQSTGPKRSQTTAYRASPRSSKVKLGPVCGIGWLAEPHEKGKETKGGSIARTTWQQPSRLNEANSLSPSLFPSPFTLSLSLSFPPSLPLHPSAPFIPSFSPSQPLFLPLAPSRTLAASSSLGAAPHRPKSILERRRGRGNDGHAKEKDVIQITDQPGFPLISSVSGERPPARRGRSRAAGKQPSSSSTSQLGHSRAGRSKARLVSMCHAQRSPGSQGRAPGSLEIGIANTAWRAFSRGGTAEGYVWRVAGDNQGSGRGGGCPQKGKFADESSKSREPVNGTSNGDIREDFGQPRLSARKGEFSSQMSNARTL